MSRLRLVVALAGICAAASAQDAESLKVEQRAREIRGRFADRSGQETTRDRKITVAALARIITEESTQDGGFSVTKAQALTELRAYSDIRETFDILISEIDYGYARYVDSSPPISHYPAAMSLITCGIASRGRMLRALGEQQSDQRLSLMVAILVELDQDTDGLDGEYASRTAITMVRLTHELEQLKWRPVADALESDRQARIKNVQRMIALLLQPNYGVQRPEPRVPR